MDELIRQLQAKTGLGADKIRQVVDGVMDFLEDKLPAPVAAQVRGLIEGGTDSAEALLGQAKDMLGGIMGRGDRREG